MSIGDQRIGPTIEIKESKTGLPVPVVQGVHLHSVYNPEKEAENFVATAKDKIIANKHLLVLGLGFGYHVKALADAMKTIHGNNWHITVVEPNAEVATEVERMGHLGEYQNISILTYANVYDFFSNESFVDFLLTKPALLPHMPSFNLYKTFFESLVTFKADSSLRGISARLKNSHIHEFLQTQDQEQTIDQFLANLSTSANLNDPMDFFFRAFSAIAGSRTEGATHE
jgi:hypothetical protein